jgi:predicted CoA-binding protein
MGGYPAKVVPALWLIALLIFGYSHLRTKAFMRGETMASADPEAIVKETRSIAVVGASNDSEKASHEVASYLKEQGYRVIPVNPTEEEVLGERTYDTVDQIPEQVDVVDVFLPSEKTPEIADDAVRAEAKVLWLQEGIENEEARRIAEDGGLTYVEDRCMRKTHESLQSS